MLPSGMYLNMNDRVEEHERLTSEEIESDLLEVGRGDMEGQVRETRDVGVDAMTHSHLSLSASFEYFDQSPLGEKASDVDLSMLEGFDDNTKRNENSCLRSYKQSYKSPESQDRDEQDQHKAESSGTTRNHSESGSIPYNQQDCNSPTKELGQSTSNKSSVTSYTDFVTDFKKSSLSKRPENQLEANDNSCYNTFESETRRKAGMGPKSYGNVAYEDGIKLSIQDKTIIQDSSQQTRLIPKLPPRRPIITNGTLHASLERGIPPPTAFLSSAQQFRFVGENTSIQQVTRKQSYPFDFPACFRQERQRLFFGRQSSLPQYFHHYDNSMAHRHVPYVNQPIPPLGVSSFCPVSSDWSTGSNILRPLSDTFSPRTMVPFYNQSGKGHHDQNNCHSVRPSQVTVSSDESLSPPPLPPRQPHISRTLDGRPQVHIRPHRIQSDPRPPRPHSFNHYIIDKSKAVPSSSSSTSSSSPTSNARNLRPRSHSETQFKFSGQSNSNLDQHTVICDETSHAIPQRRRLKTRRERSQIKHGKASICNDPSPLNKSESSYTVTESLSSSSKIKQTTQSTNFRTQDLLTSQKTDDKTPIPSTRPSVSKRPWKDTISSANVCISGSESSCEDSSGSVN